MLVYESVQVFRSLLGINFHPLLLVDLRFDLPFVYRSRAFFLYLRHLRQIVVIVVF